MARVGHFPLGIYPSFIAGMLPRLPDQLRHQVAMLAEFEPRFRQVLTGGLRDGRRRWPYGPGQP